MFKNTCPACKPPNQAIRYIDGEPGSYVGIYNRQIICCYHYAPKRI